jgi:hypothetical protein
LSTQGDVHWKISTIENQSSKFSNITVRGQFPVGDEGITMHVSNVVAQGPVYNGEAPIIQFVRGNLRTINLPLVFFARDKDENIMSMYKRMERIATRDDTLKRLPLCKFTYGQAITMKCFVQALGDVKIYRLTTQGKARRIEFTAILSRFQPYEVVQTLKGTRPRESRLQMVNSPEMRMYEFVAMREWGPRGVLYGDRLRKRNKGNPFYAPDGERTKVPNGDIILSEKVEPEFHAFDEFDEDAADLLEAKFAARNALTMVV